MEKECEQLLNFLQRMKPSGGAPSNPSSRQRNFSRFANRCLGLSAVIFFALCLFALFLEFIYTVDESWLPTIFWIGRFSIGLAFLSSAIYLFLMFVDISKFRGMALNNFTTSIQHDLWAVADLFVYSNETLEQTLRYLDLKIERTKNRLKLFIGGSEKVAFISLIGMGYSVFKEISWEFSNLWLYPLAFLIGLVLGGILLNIVMQRDIYHRELVNLTLEYKVKEQRPQSLYDMPSLPMRIRIRNNCNLFLTKCLLRFQKIRTSLLSKFRLKIQLSN